MSETFAENILAVHPGEGEMEHWRIVNDGVMGGVSNSHVRRSSSGTFLFEGRVSLENNGGFASITREVGPLDLSEFAGLAVRVRGDGQRYRLRLRTDSGLDGIAYQSTFETASRDWQITRLPFDLFVPTYRGRTPGDADPLDRARIRQIGFMIADGQEGPFRLEIDWVRALRR